MRDQFKKAVLEHRQTFGVDLSDQAVERLGDYFELFQEHNPILHLVAPCSPEEFATRHVLESLTLLEYLDRDAGFADVGTGAGLPSIPCLIAGEDLRGLLIESKEKKGRFLDEAIRTLGLAGRATLVNRQFEEVDAKTFDYVTCRALDGFTQKLPRLKKWAADRPMLLFGGPVLGDTLKKLRISFGQKLLPLSERRYLFLTGRLAASAGGGVSDANSSML